MKGFLAAIRFLTVLPLPGKWGTRERELAGSPVYFPVVGLLLGVVAAAAAIGVAEILPMLPAAALLIILLVAFSGGFHLDGLSDTADGFLSSRTRKRILEIMKDSRTGVMGVMAIVCVLLLKVAAVSSIPEEKLWRVIFLMPLAGRCSLVISMAVLPYARAEGGLGKLFLSRRRPLSGAWGAALLGFAGWHALGWAGLATAGATVLVTLLFCAYCYRKIGGATGDTLGAMCEIAELVPALVMAGWCFYA